MQSEPVLQVSDLDASYGKVQVLQDVSLSVGDGEIVSVLGPNGAGKTTLMGTIAGVVGIDRGDVRFKGKSIAGDAPESIVRLGIAMVPEGRRVLTSLTVAENLRLAAGATQRTLEQDPDLAALLDEFPILRDRAHSSAGALSGGEQQQLALARALATKPKLLMLDEPSLGLAPTLVDRVFRVVSSLNERGVTILLVEQYASRALALSSHVYVLRRGKVEAAGRPAELQEAGYFEKAYFGFKE